MFTCLPALFILTVLIACALNADGSDCGGKKKEKKSNAKEESAVCSLFI